LSACETSATSGAHPAVAGVQAAGGDGDLTQRAAEPAGQQDPGQQAGEQAGGERDPQPAEDGERRDRGCRLQQHHPVAVGGRSPLGHHQAALVHHALAHR
jgi:hypothetical protein